MYIFKFSSFFPLSVPFVTLKKGLKVGIEADGGLENLVLNYLREKIQIEKFRKMLKLAALTGRS